MTGDRMRKICIITNQEKDEGLEVTRQIQKLLCQSGVECFLTERFQTGDGGYYTKASEIPNDVDCVIVLGGDGTLLQAAHDLAFRGIPIFGINLGTLGFLAETERSGIQKAVSLLLGGEYEIEKRMMLSAGRYGRESQKEILPDALNDLVITRSGFSRLIAVSVYINGELVNNYRGDGVIISTPTGSTGYNLSAGGPILSPSANMMAVTPICPHSLNARSIVVSDQDTICVRVETSKKTQVEEAIATVDGNYSVNLKAEDQIVISRSEHTTKLIRLNGRSFFSVLRMKIGGGYGSGGVV